MVENWCSVRRIKEIDLLSLFIVSPKTHTHTHTPSWAHLGYYVTKYTVPLGTESRRLTMPAHRHVWRVRTRWLSHRAAMELGLVVVAGM